MAHGTPRDYNNFEEFLTSIRRGRPPETELLQEVKRRYSLIGGLSPLTDITESFFNKLETQIEDSSELNQTRYNIICSLGYKHVNPKIESAVKSLIAKNVETIIGLIASAYYSKVNIEDYNKAVRDTLTESSRSNVTYLNLPPLCELEGYPELIAKRLEESLRKHPESLVIFSAHSLPLAALQQDRTYQNQHEKLAATVASLCKVRDYVTAYQSGTLGSGNWLGPDVNEVIRSREYIAYNSVIVAPIGFVSDHAEILYDLDIELKANCEANKVNYSRIEMFNDSSDFIQLLIKSIFKFFHENV